MSIYSTYLVVYLLCRMGNVTNHTAAARTAAAAACGAAPTTSTVAVVIVLSLRYESPGVVNVERDTTGLATGHCGSTVNSYQGTCEHGAEKNDAYQVYVRR